MGDEKGSYRILDCGKTEGGGHTWLVLAAIPRSGYVTYRSEFYLVFPRSRAEIHGGILEYVGTLPTDIGPYDSIWERLTAWADGDLSWHLQQLGATGPTDLPPLMDIAPVADPERTLGQLCLDSRYVGSLRLIGEKTEAICLQEAIDGACGR